MDYKQMKPATFSYLHRSKQELKHFRAPARVSMRALIYLNKRMSEMPLPFTFG